MSSNLNSDCITSVTSYCPVCVTDCDKFSPASTTIMLMVLVFQSLLFGLFTAVMCLNQLCAITSDQTVRIRNVNYLAHFHSFLFANSGVLIITSVSMCKVRQLNVNSVQSDPGM